MSRQLVATKLQGYDGPFHAADNLRDVCDLPIRELCGANLEEACRSIPGYKRQSNPITQDRYAWFWGQHFITPNGEVAILFPWAQDQQKADGSSADRAVAVYTKGKVWEGEISSLTERLAINLREMFERTAALKAQS
jgi:hypothetical protein